MLIDKMVVYRLFRINTNQLYGLICNLLMNVDLIKWIQDLMQYR